MNNKYWSTRLPNFFHILLFTLLFSSQATADDREFEHPAQRSLTVMTQNMDAGTDLGYLFALPDNVLTAATLTYGEVLGSNLPGNAKNLARLIAKNQPDLIALQEVTLWQTVTPDLKVSVLYDQLALLLKELKKLKHPYKAVVAQTLTHSQLPIDPNLIGRPLDTAVALDFTDRDVIIARADLKQSELALYHPQKQVYSTLLTLPLGTAVRGWISVDAKIRGKSFRFVDTHLESVIPLPDLIVGTKIIQQAQAQELVNTIDTTSLPVVLAGDFNADAEFANIGFDQTDTPNIIAAAGFVDTWDALNPTDPGFTWPLFFEDPLRPNPDGPFERIDIVYARDFEVLGVRRVANFTENFAADHAGVIAKLGLLPSEHFGHPWLH
jgi:endonuclease/exonuclease/phosphatase family metal-dependent hydrolase